MKKKLPGLMAMGIALVLASCASMKKDTLTVQERFSRYDLNDDGKISLAEYSEAATRIIFATFDENDDGSVTLAEWQGLEGKESDKLFVEHDPNEDGKITLKEALATTKKKKSFSQEFPGIDANHDGSVVLAEAEAYAAKVRAEMKKK